jgi:hypothetical protein
LDLSLAPDAGARQFQKIEIAEGYFARTGVSAGTFKGGFEAMRRASDALKRIARRRP